jgi:hypothetical protein
MPTVRDVLRALLPDGSSLSPSSRRTPWRWCPIWPPDAFAVAATIASKSGCYAEAFYAPVAGEAQYFSDARCDQIVKLAAIWRRRTAPPPDVQKSWAELVSHGAFEVTNRAKLPRRLKDAVMTLMVVADETAVGMGFPAPKNGRDWKLARVLQDNYALALKRDENRPLRHLPASICWLVPPTQVCVQPKTVTPQVGVTLRSFSHNLALLPSVGEVHTEWLPVATVETEDGRRTLDHCNLLVVPYPYQVRGEAFVDAGMLPSERDEQTFRYFDLAQGWLETETGRITGKQFVDDFLVPLCEVARREIGIVHGIVLPEMSLTTELAVEICEHLSSVFGIELFIAGVVRQRDDNRSPENGAYVAIIKRTKRKTVVAPWIQGKHHRWCLDRSQIIRYHLGPALGGYPKARWWERIDVEDRRLSFHLFRPGASLAVLICEDLARIDPVQNVIRAVGPNLVVALLMDGPQLKGRWPARYATILADDPGSAVLTLTSLGMVRRSSGPTEPPSHVIALWKSAGGDAQELPLPEGAHALALTLSPQTVKQRTLDRRTDNSATEVLDLTAVRPITLGARLPGWIEP